MLRFKVLHFEIFIILKLLDAHAVKMTVKSVLFRGKDEFCLEFKPKPTENI